MFSEVFNTLTSVLLMVERVMCGICQTDRSLKTESFCSPFTLAQLYLMRVNASGVKISALTQEIIFFRLTR